MNPAEPGEGAPAAILISVGEELLLGRTVDTNAAWLGRALSDLGIRVVRGATVGDRRDAIGRTVREALVDAEVVVVTGGLGPTEDDVTREAVAQVVGRPLRLDEERLQRLRSRFEARGMGRLPEPNRSQAMVPEGSEVLENPHGTAPGLLLESEGRWVVLLPGVPREMKGIWALEVEPRLRSRFEGRLRPARHRVIHTTAIAESRLQELIAQRVPELARALGDVATLAFLPDVTGVDLRVTARARDEEEANRILDRVEGLLAPVVAPWRFDAPSGDLAEAVLEALRRAGATLATAESCTAGLVAKRLTDHAGSSEVFVGGVVAYANRVKEELLGVASSDLAAHGAVSEPVARQMARGVRARLEASVGVGVTGIAGPGGGTPEKPVGTVWIAVSTDAGGEEARRLHLPGDRAEVRARAAQAALWRVFRALRNGSGGGGS